MRFIDSHTEGEPTRVIIEGGPELGTGPLQDRLNKFREQYDDLRSFIVNEPRGSEAVVGALLCPPSDSRYDSGVIFFNNKGFLNMCGHGAIGVAVTLAHLGLVKNSECWLETSVGAVKATLFGSNRVAIENVPSYLFSRDVQVQVDGVGPIVGDIAWGGNWFYLVENSPIKIEPCNIAELNDLGRRVRFALEKEGIRGADGACIDHVEFFGPPFLAGADSKNFVYCPGGAYDRSPCGTGTSAKLACLAAKGKLAVGETWIQESIIGSRFEASYTHLTDAAIMPRIVGEAYLCSEGTLIRQPNDPFRNGIQIPS